MASGTINQPFESRQGFTSPLSTLQDLTDLLASKPKYWDAGVRFWGKDLVNGLFGTGTTNIGAVGYSLRLDWDTVQLFMSDSYSGWVGVAVYNKDGTVSNIKRWT